MRLHQKVLHLGVEWHIAEFLPDDKVLLRSVPNRNLETKQIVANIKDCRDMKNIR